MNIDSSGRPLAPGGPSTPLGRMMAAAMPEAAAVPSDRVDLGVPASPRPFPAPVASLVGVSRSGVLRPSASAVADPNGSHAHCSCHPHSPINEHAPPLSQARELKQVLMARIMETFDRKNAVPVAECRADLQFFAWASDKLESLSRALESAHDAAGNAEVEGIQKELAGAVTAFEQIHAGAMQSEQFRANYTAQNEAARNLDVSQTNAAMVARRAATIAAYSSTRGIGYCMPPPMPPPMPGVPAPGLPVPGVPVAGAPVPGAPAPVPGAPVPAPGTPAPPAPVQTVYIPYYPGGMPYGWPRNRVHIDVPPMHGEHGRRDC